MDAEAAISDSKFPEIAALKRGDERVAVENATPVGAWSRKGRHLDA